MKRRYFTTALSTVVASSLAGCSQLPSSRLPGDRTGALTITDVESIQVNATLFPPQTFANAYASQSAVEQDFGPVDDLEEDTRSFISNTDFSTSILVLSVASLPNPCYELELQSLSTHPENPTITGSVAKNSITLRTVCSQVIGKGALLSKVQVNRDNLSTDTLQVDWSVTSVGDRTEEYSFDVSLE